MSLLVGPDGMYASLTSAAARVKLRICGRDMTWRVTVKPADAKSQRTVKRSLSLFP